MTESEADTITAFEQGLAQGLEEAAQIAGDLVWKITPETPRDIARKIREWAADDTENAIFTRSDRLRYLIDCSIMQGDDYWREE